jgi:hypothetical protein
MGQSRESAKWLEKKKTFMADTLSFQLKCPLVLKD